MNPLILELRRFFIALAYFSRLPIPAWVGWQAEELNRASRYFPWVGIVIGVLCALVLCLTTWYLPVSLIVLLSMVVSLRLTGAFHEDGLADAADGLGGGWERAQVLTIMKDSRVGTYGAASLFMALAIKWTALTHLMHQHLRWAVLGLLLAHSLSRAAALVLMWALPYVREDETSRAKPVAQGILKREVIIGLLAPISISLLVLACGGSSVRLLLAWAACACILLWWGRLLRRRLGGYTGDCLGAAQQFCELAVYGVACLII